ncbi:GFA family protein [Sphingomonas bacterium]|uniref:GFA family protein n=1 Tax=Sphingomonas bacterium TaxID=1895847 RepID=UPI00345B8575
MKAQCQCGLLSVDAAGPSLAVAMCHCTACQRRTGHPYGVLAYYPAAALTIAGEATRYVRTADSGAEFETFFCPCCGSTVYARAGKHPELIGVAWARSRTRPARRRSGRCGRRRSTTGSPRPTRSRTSHVE